MTRRALGALRLLRWATRWVLPAERRYLHDEQRFDHATMARLARILAFVAGALNAGGFMALGFYTSHCTGNVSRAADEAVLGHWFNAGSAGVLVGTFLVGAFVTGLLLSYGRRRRFKARYAFTLAIEAVLLTLFGLSGDAMARETFFAPGTAVLLSFVMGMHNAVITKISKAVVRTTHMTGNVTDLGIELAQLIYTNRSQGPRVKPIIANRPILFLHLFIILSFFTGGLVGAYAFRRFGYISALPLALLLGVLSFRPLLLDIESRSRVLLNRSRA